MRLEKRGRMIHMVADAMPCSRCDGCGKVALPPELQSTLDFVRQHPRGGALVREVHAAMSASGPTAANNRLEKLRSLGLLWREKVSAKAWMYMPGASGNAKKF